MSKIAETRLTLASLIYGVEIDLKNCIKKNITPYFNNLSFFKDNELEKRVIERFEKENPGVDFIENIDEVIEFLDFHDTFSILNKNKEFLRKDTADYLKTIFQCLCDLTPIRNRVMHTRPLLGGDFSFTYDFVSSLKKTDPIDWLITIDTREKIDRDPSYVLTLKFPLNHFEEEIKQISHNLPVPDFDETGFIGRTQDVDVLTKLVLSNRVVSVLGDGGIGKTALALKVAYDIVDMGEKCPFELIIWTSAKTTMLTSKGIEDIYTTITDYTGLIGEIGETLGANKLEEILEYLDFFKTLLVIDNLETIQSEEVRNFIRNAQTKCHLLITSRIGLGELEYPRKLNGLTEVESAKLIREIARIRNSETLMKLPQKTLVEISSKLYFNPLAIKWFVSTVESGIAPHEVLNNKDDLLDFCLTNVYENLSDGAISILKTIRAARKKITNAEVIYLSEFEPLEVRKYLLELFKTTLISREIQDGNNYEEVIYYISDFAKDFLAKKYPIEEGYIKSNIRKSKELNTGIRKINKAQRYNEFSVNALVYDNQNQMISAKFLQEALQLSKNGDFESALGKVKEAKNIDPNYFEVYRVGAFIKATQGDLLSAEEDYQLGLEIAPNNVRLLFYYAQFLMFKLEDVDTALIYAKQVYDQKPNHPYTAFLIARCFNTAQEFNKAIQVVRELKDNVELDPKNLRIANTELISYYFETAKSMLTIQTDIDNGINHFKKAFELFEQCAVEKIVDYKMSKNFSIGVLTFIRMLPVVKIDEFKPYLISLITNNDGYINLTVDLKEKIILSFRDKFLDNSLNQLIDFKGNDDRKVGNIRRTRDQKDNFAFIQTDLDEYYAHRYDFIDVATWADWKAIKNGQLVSFEEGHNKQGKCAKAVKTI
ncbi:tetratricopeptide repeat protein [Sunxiuqinia elliptica]|uniref:NB-ARC domain-containing protein n=1 Tax=Sunxiuqinia elliptica TaxID=655355 RepID=A0A4R6H6X4_9BACT|nr:NB-ARC domain-containing protein [Sunxiuqinia elliptica]TDO03215.1 NB-ARC domain-containing protein [Sunxiuqinia elliptica]TDO59412.1 NB-ARC domain-containing protein [Sunxiuqinia elliptica]